LTTFIDHRRDESGSQLKFGGTPIFPSRRC